MPEKHQALFNSQTLGLVDGNALQALPKPFGLSFEERGVAF